MSIENMREIPTQETETKINPEKASGDQNKDDAAQKIDAGELAERSAEQAQADAAAVAEAEKAIREMGIGGMPEAHIEGSSDDAEKLQQEINDLQAQVDGLKAQGALRRLFGGGKIKHLETLIEEKQQLALENDFAANASPEQKAQRQQANVKRAIR